MSRTGGAISPLPKTRRSLRTRGLAGLSAGFFEAAGLFCPAARASAARPRPKTIDALSILIAIVSRQGHLGVQPLAARARSRELELFDDQELREGLDDGQEPLEPGVGAGIREGHLGPADLFLLEISITVIDVGDD